jgi:hypothetical protein
MPILKRFIQRNSPNDCLFLTLSRSFYNLYKAFTFKLYPLDIVGQVINMSHINQGDKK